MDNLIDVSLHKIYTFVKMDQFGKYMTALKGCNVKLVIWAQA
jgi:hypothetical protein